MRGQLALMTLLGAFVTATMVFAWSPLWSATATDIERQTEGIPLVKKGILDATSYAENDVELVMQDSQFTVTVINSGLNKLSSREREMEASKIVSAITQVIANKPEFKSILGVHINYVARTLGSGHTDPVDGIDFRKDPAGNFVHHTT